MLLHLDIPFLTSVPILYLLKDQKTKDFKMFLEGKKSKKTCQKSDTKHFQNFKILIKWHVSLAFYPKNMEALPCNNTKSIISHVVLYLNAF